MTAFFIDRRLNPKGKSLANRQRFLRRARAQIREAVQKSLKDSDVADAGKERKVRISNQGTKEPRFRLDPGKGGKRDFVLPGNKHFVAGDQIKKPQQGQSGASGKDAATSGDTEDDFEFTMRAEEILDIFFEDLELPNLVRTTLTDAQISTWKRAGITTAYIDPGKPWQNGADESFNGKFRDEFLTLQWFRNRVDAKVGIEQWRRHYNEVRPHSSLGYLPPAEFEATYATVASR